MVMDEKTRETVLEVEDDALGTDTQRKAARIMAEERAEILAALRQRFKMSNKELRDELNREPGE